MRATKLCRIEWCGAPRNMSGYCPQHKRLLEGESGRWTPELERARSRAKAQCHRAGVAYSPSASARPAAAAPSPEPKR